MHSLIKTVSKITRKYIRKITNNYYKKKYSTRYTGNGYSLVTSNCIGGIINNRLGQPQNSPTFNLWFEQSDFIKFVINLEYYLNQDLVFIDSKEHSYPVAKLDDIQVNFQHYHSVEEARDGWERRKKRIKWDSIYIIMYEDDVTREELMLLENVSCKKLIVLTSSKNNLDLPYLKYIEKDKHGRDNDFVFLDSDFLGRLTFEKQWDYVEWLNN